MSAREYDIGQSSGALALVDKGLDVFHTADRTCGPAGFQTECFSHFKSAYETLQLLTVKRSGIRMLIFAFHKRSPLSICQIKS